MGAYPYFLRFTLLRKPLPIVFDPQKPVWRSKELIACAPALALRRFALLCATVIISLRLARGWATTSCHDCKDKLWLNSFLKTSCIRICEIKYDLIKLKIKYVYFANNPKRHHKEEKALSPSRCWCATMMQMGLGVVSPSLLFFVGTTKPDSTFDVSPKIGGPHPK